ncbi:hypothetical protein SSX86_005249 [Deinandra increscens subsp. villosa]|uniref:Zinc finger protein n=1 Tax=Deinandra increscens subsp. villosa TaxID=3103831 RepID=A0AAP0DTI0_9ASTR
MMKQDSNPTTAATNHPTLATVCGQCGVEERKLLHNVRLRGNFRRLCTSCVLRLHPQCFCPACLGVYERLPPDDAVVCYKCYSSSHPTCVSSPPAGTISSSRGPSPCSSCLNPNLLVLNLNRLENGNGSRKGGRVIDCNAARLLLAAGKIASMSMSKAEVAAAMEAERRSKEAAYTKKRAREALDHVVRLMGKEKRNAVESGRKIVHLSSNNNNNNNSNNNSNSVVAVMPPVVVVDANVVNKVDDSNEVLKALNAVELKDNGVQVPGVPVPVDESVVSGSQGEDVVAMEVDVSGKDKDLGFSSVAENGSVKNDELVKSDQIGQEQEQEKEKVQAMVESNVGSPKN